jgi:hypothetical protein
MTPLRHAIKPAMPAPTQDKPDHLSSIVANATAPAAASPVAAPAGFPDSEKSFVDRFKKGLARHDAIVARERETGLPPAEQRFVDSFKKQVVSSNQKATAAQAKPKTPTAREQAQTLMDDLNARRRAAMGEVPDGPQTVAEINRLLDISNRERNAPLKKMPLTKESFPQGGPVLERGPYKPKPSLPGDEPAIKQMRGSSPADSSESKDEREFSSRFRRSVGKPAANSTELPPVPPARSPAMSATKERLLKEIGEHPQRMQDLEDRTQRNGAASRMAGLERFEKDQLGYVVNPQSEEMKTRHPTEPEYDEQGRPTLRGTPKGPRVVVTHGPGEVSKLKDPAAEAERRRLQFVRRIMDAHQLGPDAGELMRDPTAFSHDDLRKLHESLRDAEGARRKAALADRWANFHMGSDLMRGHPRAQGLYMRSLARAAAEGDPTMMTAVNQGHGNLIGANQTAGMAMNQANVQQRREQAHMGAAMLDKERAAGLPDAQLQLRNAALKRALSMPEPNRTANLTDMGVPPQEVRRMVAMHEAGQGNANHPEVLGFLQGMSEQQREAWLREHFRGPNGQRLTAQEARAASDSMRSGAGRAGGIITDLFRPSVAQ